MPEPQKAFLFNKNSQPGENTPRDEGRPFDNLRSSHQQASLKDMTKGTQKMTPGRQGHPRTGKEHVYPLCPGVEGQSSHATRDCSRPEGSSGGRGGVDREHARARLQELQQVRVAGLGTRCPPEARPQSHGGGWDFTPGGLGAVAHVEAGPSGCRERSEGSWRWTVPWGRGRGDRERQDHEGTTDEPQTSLGG